MTTIDLMTAMDQRRHQRIDSLNLSYICLDDAGNTVHEGMGRTLNVSESGFLLETHFPVDPGLNLSLTVAIENELVDIRGKVARSIAKGDNLYQTGIEFIRPDAQALSVIRKYITFFNQESQAQSKKETQ
jgi:hypothetical protein